jgi:hypothetical protein
VQRFSSIFSQLLQLVPRFEFEQAVKKHRSDYSAKGFTSWGQFVAMLFCQIGRAHSLREICGGLASCEGKLRHLGVSDSPKRSTLSYANAHRPWSLYQTVFEQLLAKCQTAVAGRGTRKKFRFKNKLVSLDSSVIDLSLSLFDWAQFRRTKGAVKFHLLLDHDGCLPSLAVVTNGKTSDVTVARRFRFERGTVVAMDGGYIDYEWFAQLTHQGVYFVTRLKDNAAFKVVENRPIPAGNNIIKDQIVFFHSQATPDLDHLSPIVEIWDEKKERTFFRADFWVWITSASSTGASRSRLDISNNAMGLPGWRCIRSTCLESPWNWRNSIRATKTWPASSLHSFFMSPPGPN